MISNFIPNFWISPEVGTPPSRWSENNQIEESDVTGNFPTIPERLVSDLIDLVVHS